MQIAAGKHISASEIRSPLGEWKDKAGRDFENRLGGRGLDLASFFLPFPALVFPDRSASPFERSYSGAIGDLGSRAMTPHAIAS